MYLCSFFLELNHSLLNYIFFTEDSIIAYSNAANHFTDELVFSLELTNTKQQVQTHLRTQACNRPYAYDVTEGRPAALGVKRNTATCVIVKHAARGANPASHTAGLARPGPRTERLSANAHCQHNTCALRDTRLASLLWRCDPLWRQCIRSIQFFCQTYAHALMLNLIQTVTLTLTHTLIRTQYIMKIFTLMLWRRRLCQRNCLRPTNERPKGDSKNKEDSNARKIKRKDKIVKITRKQTR